VSDALKWMGGIALVGFLLMVIEYRFAIKKKEGYTVVDRKRILGILWITVFLAALIGWIVWVAPD
jgi:hypothetical protein